MHEQYLDSEVLTAGPIKLVQLMYRGALDAVVEARVALASGDIARRSNRISKANAILLELALSLDHSQYPQFSKNVVELYDYMMRRLNEANIQQVAAPLDEVEKLLTELLQAWQQAGVVEQATSYGTSAVAYSSEPAEYQSISFAY